MGVGVIMLCIAFAIWIICQHPASGAYLLMAETNSGAIYQMDVTTQVVQRLPLPSQINPIALAYDNVTASIFWSTVEPGNSGFIKTTPADGSTLRAINITNGLPLNVVDGLTFDPVGRRVYYTDTGPKVICSMNASGGEHRVLVKQLLEQPRAIAVVPSINKMYWTDWGTVPHIARANMADGSDIEFLIQEDVTMQWPNGLAVDTATNEMFWCDGGLGRIEKASLSGSSRRLLSVAQGQHYFGLAIDDTSVYVTGWTLTGVYQVSRSGGSLQSFGPRMLMSRLNSIVFVRASTPNVSMTTTTKSVTQKLLTSLKPASTRSLMSSSATTTGVKATTMSQSTTTNTSPPLTTPVPRTLAAANENASTVYWRVEVIAIVSTVLLLTSLVVHALTCYMLGLRSRRYKYQPSVSFTTNKEAEISDRRGAEADMETERKEKVNFADNTSKVKATENVYRGLLAAQNPYRKLHEDIIAEEDREERPYYDIKY